MGHNRRCPENFVYLDIIESSGSPIVQDEVTIYIVHAWILKSELKILNSTVGVALSLSFYFLKGKKKESFTFLS